MNPEQEQVIQSLHTEIDRILQLSTYQMRKLELVALFNNLHLRAERAEQEIKLLADIREQDLFSYLTLKKERDSLQSKLSVAEQNIEEMREALWSIYKWYDRDGSVGGASDIFEDNRKVLSTTPSTKTRPCLLCDNPALSFSQMCSQCKDEWDATPPTEG